jgi:predicted RNA-binding protein
VINELNYDVYMQKRWSEEHKLHAKNSTKKMTKKEGDGKRSKTTA